MFKKNEMLWCLDADTTPEKPEERQLFIEVGHRATSVFASNAVASLECASNNDVWN